MKPTVWLLPALVTASLLALFAACLLGSTPMSPERVLAGGEEGEQGRGDQRREEPDILFHVSLPSASASMASIRNQPLQEVHAPSSETTGWSASWARATGWFMGLQASG